VPDFAKQPLFRKNRDATATGTKRRLDLSTINSQPSLKKMRDYISASGSVDREHLEADNVLGPIYEAFGEQLWPLIDELNLTLAA